MNAWQLLNNPRIWEWNRIGLDLMFGLYQRRFALMHEWHVLDNQPDVLDIGCGLGQYSRITDGKYLGVDLNHQYIDYAAKRNRASNKAFRCQDVVELLDEKSRFDMVLMVDFLHHIPDEICIKLLRVASQLARYHIVSFEPITFQPHPVGDWIVRHDRGNHMRSLDSLHILFQSAGLKVDQSVELRLGPINTRAILAHPVVENIPVLVNPAEYLEN